MTKIIIALFLLFTEQSKYDKGSYRALEEIHQHRQEID
jgi:hypothetical protein